MPDWITKSQRKPKTPPCNRLAKERWQHEP
jgi:hypothetical protein